MAGDNEDATAELTEVLKTAEEKLEEAKAELDEKRERLQVSEQEKKDVSDAAATGETEHETEDAIHATNPEDQKERTATGDPVNEPTEVQGIHPEDQKEGTASGDPVNEPSEVEGIHPEDQKEGTAAGDPVNEPTEVEGIHPEDQKERTATGDPVNEPTGVEGIHPEDQKEETAAGDPVNEPTEVEGIHPEDQKDSGYRIRLTRIERAQMKKELLIHPRRIRKEANRNHPATPFERRQRRCKWREFTLKILKLRKKNRSRSDPAELSPLRNVEGIAP